MGLERKRLEFSVGIFVIIGVFCLGYLSFTLGNFSISRDRYEVSAIFSTVSGLKTKAQIMMAGVNIGEVKNVKLKDDQRRSRHEHKQKCEARGRRNRHASRPWA